MITRKRRVSARFSAISAGVAVTGLMSLDLSDPVVDTGTQSNEIALGGVIVIRCVREKALDWGVQRMSNRLRRTCQRLTENCPIRTTVTFPAFLQAALLAYKVLRTESHPE